MGTLTLTFLLLAIAWINVVSCKPVGNNVTPATSTTTAADTNSTNETTVDPSTACGGVVGFFHICPDNSTSNLVTTTTTTEGPLFLKNADKSRQRRETSDSLQNWSVENSAPDTSEEFSVEPDPADQVRSTYDKRDVGDSDPQGMSGVLQGGVNESKKVKRSTDDSTEGKIKRESGEKSKSGADNTENGKARRETTTADQKKESSMKSPVDERNDVKTRRDAQNMDKKEESEKIRRNVPVADTENGKARRETTTAAQKKESSMKSPVDEGNDAKTRRDAQNMDKKEGSEKTRRINVPVAEKTKETNVKHRRETLEKKETPSEIRRNLLIAKIGNSNATKARRATENTNAVKDASFKRPRDVPAPADKKSYIRRETIQSNNAPNKKPREVTATKDETPLAENKKNASLKTRRQTPEKPVSAAMNTRSNPRLLRDVKLSEKITKTRRDVSQTETNNAQSVGATLDVPVTEKTRDHMITSTQILDGFNSDSDSDSDSADSSDDDSDGDRKKRSIETGSESIEKDEDSDESDGQMKLDEQAIIKRMRREEGTDTDSENDSLEDEDCSETVKRDYDSDSVDSDDRQKRNEERNSERVRQDSDGDSLESDERSEDEDRAKREETPNKRTRRDSGNSDNVEDRSDSGKLAESSNKMRVVRDYDSNSYDSDENDEDDRKRRGIDEVGTETRRRRELQEVKKTIKREAADATEKPAASRKNILTVKEQEVQIVQETSKRDVKGSSTAVDNYSSTSNDPASLIVRKDADDTESNRHIQKDIHEGERPHSFSSYEIMRRTPVIFGNL